jgi:membrane protein insertase Oxa1/YidC/SpoIIIJ
MAHWSRQLNEELNYQQKIGAVDEKIAKHKYRTMVFDEKERLVTKHNCRPSKAIMIGFLDLPLWICFFLSLRNLAIGFPPSPLNQLARDQLVGDGLLWFTNLTIPDPTYILPATVCIIHLCTHYYHRLHLKQNNIPESKIMYTLGWVSKGLTPLLFVLCAHLPASVSIYWVTNGLAGLAQSVAVTYPNVKHMMGVKVTGLESKPLDFKLLFAKNSLKNVK